MGFEVGLDYKISECKFICFRQKKRRKEVCKSGIIVCCFENPHVMFEVIVVKNNQKIVYWSNFSPVLVGMFALCKTGQQSKLPTFGRFSSLPIL